MTKPSATVLVVEDEPILLYAIAEDLRDAGFTVTEARNADDALRQLQAQADIRVVFTDIQMPGSMDGLGLAARVRHQWPEVKIIVTSGNLRPKAEVFPEGGLFLAKPYAAQSVAVAIQSLLSDGMT